MNPARETRLTYEDAIGREVIVVLLALAIIGGSLYARMIILPHRAERLMTRQVFEAERLINAYERDTTSIRRQQGSASEGVRMGDAATVEPLSVKLSVALMDLPAPLRARVEIPLIVEAANPSLFVNWPTTGRRPGLFDEVDTPRSRLFASAR